MNNEKLFYWKDLSGRGFKANNLTVDIIKESDDVTNWNGEALHEWATEAEEGDEWANHNEKYICTQS